MERKVEVSFIKRFVVPYPVEEGHVVALLWPAEGENAAVVHQRLVYPISQQRLWESQGVLNPLTIFLEPKFYLLQQVPLGHIPPPFVFGILQSISHRRICVIRFVQIQHFFFKLSYLHLKLIEDASVALSKSAENSDIFIAVHVGCESWKTVRIRLHYESNDQLYAQL
jgi:hypothetical protein